MTYYVYIMSNDARTVLYMDMTNGLIKTCAAASGGA